MKNKKESGFIGLVVALVVIVAVVVLGYFAYQNFKKNPVDLSNIKGTINENIDATKQDVEKAKADAIQDAKNNAADALKNKVDETIGTK